MSDDPFDPDPGAHERLHPDEPGRRLPPPVFPEGGVRPPSRRMFEAALRHLGDAYISPDDPVPPRRPREEPEDIEDIDPDEVVVTGIGNDPHLDPLELLMGADPVVIEVVETVEKLAEALKRRGKAGLHVTPGMSRFEATLRAYCVGYLAGRAAELEGE